MGDFFDDAPADTGRREQDMVPTGDYRGRVIECSFFEDRNGIRRESWWLQIDAGPYAGSTVQRFSEINARNASRVKGTFLKVCSDNRSNVTWDELYDPEARQTSAWAKGVTEGAVVDFHVKVTEGHTKTFVDVYINALVRHAPKDGGARSEKPPAAPSPGAVAEKAGDGWDDEIPF